MLAAAAKQPPEIPADADQRVILNGVDWAQFEAFLAMRGDDAGVRIAYRDGTLELVSPSRSHEHIKTALARLIEAYADETGGFCNGYGSMTMKSRAEKCAIEPDECYSLRPLAHPDQPPDLAIEVVWTSGALLDKRAIYADLGVRELWQWRKGVITVFTLRGRMYVPIAASEVLPGIDIARVAALALEEDQTAAARKYRAELRTRG